MIRVKTSSHAVAVVRIYRKLMVVETQIESLYVTYPKESKQGGLCGSVLTWQAPFKFLTTGKTP